MQYFGNENPWDILGVGADAPSEEIRRVYLEKVKLYPPDKNPEQFEKIRDAYELLNNPRERARTMIITANPKLALTELVKSKNRTPHFTGPKPWLNILRHKTT